VTSAGDESSNSGAGLPWAFVLDPAANAAALTDVQRQGLEAARRLVDRVVARSERSSGGGPAAADGSSRGTAEDSRQGDPLGDLIRCWTELTTQVMEQLAEEHAHRRPAGSGHDGCIVVPVDGSGPQGAVRLRLEGGPDGGLHAASEFWLSNPGDRPVGPVELGVRDLHTPGGHELAGSAVRFDPRVIDGLAPGSRRLVGVTASTDRRSAPGAYRGIIQSEGAPELMLALEIERPPSGR